MSESKISPESGRSTPSLAIGRSITLQVGERRFVTTTETLTEESEFFAALLSGRWDNEDSDGAYYIDADPELFDHIMRYLRRGVLPIFYDNISGHDHARYLALMGEARFFRIPRLESWLEKKGYLQALKISYTADEIEGLPALSTTRGSDEQVEHHPIWETRKVYVCPRGIPVHKGNQILCGRQCKNARGDGGNIYEDEQVLKTLVIRKKIIFDQAACMEGKNQY